MISFWNKSAITAALALVWILDVDSADADASAATQQQQQGIIVLEDFSDPQHVWTQMNDPVMGGKSTGTFTINSSTGLGEFVGTCAIVPFLKAPGFIKVESTPGESWPDVSSCEGIQITAKASTDYSGYRVSFGKNSPEGAMPYTHGYKTDMSLGKDTTQFSTMSFPFGTFTDYWDAGTGNAVVKCEDDNQYCPDDATKKDLSSIAIWGEGVEGDVHLELKTITAYGCTETETETKTVNDTTSVVSADDEIMVEDFSDQNNEWITLNDPVMGGQSKSSLSISDGVAHFEGYCAIVPFLQAPGFITMVAGRYDQGPAVFPDISTCSALKVVLRSKVEYKGYYISFGNARGRGHAMGYKAPLTSVPMEDYGEMILNFSDFSSSWDDATGKTIVTCADDGQYCPTVSTLQDMQTISFWGEGVEGEVKLDIKSISAVGCSSAGGNYSKGYGPMSSDQHGHEERAYEHGSHEYNHHSDEHYHGDYGHEHGSHDHHSEEHYHGDHKYGKEVDEAVPIGTSGLSSGTYIFIALAACGGTLLGGLALDKIKRSGRHNRHLYGAMESGGHHSLQLKVEGGEQC